MNKNAMYCSIYRLRKEGRIKIDTRQRTIFYEYQNPDDEKRIVAKSILRLCERFGFVRQATMIK